MPNPFCQRKSHAVFSAMNFVWILLAVTLLAQVARGEEKVLLLKAGKAEVSGDFRMLLWLNGEPVSSNCFGSLYFHDHDCPLWEKENQVKLELDMRSAEPPIHQMDLMVRWLLKTEVNDPFSEAADKVETPAPLFYEQRISVPKDGVIERLVKVKSPPQVEDILAGMQKLTPEDVEGVKRAYLAFAKAMSEENVEEYKKHFDYLPEEALDEATVWRLFPEGKVVYFAGKSEVEVHVGKKLALVRVRPDRILDGVFQWKLIEQSVGELHKGAMNSLLVSKNKDGKWAVWPKGWKPMVLKGGKDGE